MLEGATCVATLWEAPRSWERPGTHPPVSLQKEASPSETFLLVLVSPFSDFRPPEDEKSVF